MEKIDTPIVKDDENKQINDSSCTDNNVILKPKEEKENKAKNRSKKVDDSNNSSFKLPQESFKSTKSEVKEANPSDNISYPVWNVWESREPYVLSDCALSLKGYSVAALRTNFYIAELGVLLDAGLSAPNFKIDHIFITHGHSDHCANLPFHIYGARLGVYKTKIHVPEESLEFLNNFIIYGYCMSSHVDKEIKKEELYVHQYYEMIPHKADDKIKIEVKNRNFEVEVIKCDHSIPCLGYGFIEKRMKLKQEYIGLKGKEIGDLKKQGIEINFEQEFYSFLYLGDTSKEIFKEEKIKKYKNIMIECTFLFDDDYDQADKTFHIHWKDLKVYVNENPQINFILIHFSQRYKKSEIIDFFEKESDIKNIYPWLN